MDETTKLVADILYKAQKEMPPGQSWNLYSTGACEALAEKVTGALETSGSITQKQKNAIVETIEELVMDKLIATREYNEETIGEQFDMEVEETLEDLARLMGTDL
jgi:hypothetical protein